MRRPSRLPLPALLTGAVTAAGLCVAAGFQDPSGGLISPNREAMLAAITPDSLRGHVAFLASDFLEGRDTPSPGLDIAAEYIASQFRAAGLEPIGDDGYFQTASWSIRAPEPSSYRLGVELDGKSFRPALENVSITPGGTGPIAVQGASIRKVELDGLDDLDSDALRNLAVVVEFPKPTEATREAQMAAYRARSALLRKLEAFEPAVLIEVDRVGTTGSGLGRPRLMNPEDGQGGLRLGLAREGIPSVTVHGGALAEALAALPAGPVEGTVSFELGAPVDRPVTLRNVAGLLRGSDPKLAETYVLVSAHYDHVGLGEPGSGADRIFNGANDDASGTAAVVEIAGAMAKLEPRPKRSIVFLTWFGEEKGLLGSRYYGKHPLVPLEQTVALLNLEQVGRTDDLEGARVAGASMTGFDYSDVGAVVARAGQAVGVEISKHPRNSDAFFGRSDNQALADAGIPAHTLCTAFMFPDYHRVGDHWDALDYDNYALVTKAAALGLALLADSPEPPRWNAENPRTERYRAASERLHQPDAPAEPAPDVEDAPKAPGSH